MYPPPKYLKPHQSELICKLNKGLYGIKQAGRKLYLKLAATFGEMSFRRANGDHAVFYQTGENPIIVRVDVDDMTIAAKQIETITARKHQLRKYFEISDLGELHWLLSIEVKRDRAA